MRGEIMGILIIVAMLVSVSVVKRLILRSNLEKVKALIEKIEETEIDARFGK